MDERGLIEVRPQLEDYARQVFAGFARSDQREAGLRYLRGLMLDGRRKSMQPMAERLGASYQQVQQFVTSSTWDVTDVRRWCARLAVDLIAPQVWVIDDTGFPKDGKASPCAARQYSGALGKVANCQIGVSVHAATEAASAMLGACLFVPESWDETCVPDADGKVSNEHAHRIAVHEPNLLGLTAGANSLFAETGANPRDTQAETTGHRGRDIGDCKTMLYEAGYGQLQTGPGQHVPLAEAYRR